MYNLIDGKKVASYIKDNVREKTDELRQCGCEITLAVIIVGSDPASLVYVKNKKKACEYVGFKSLEFCLPESATQQQVLELIDSLNADESVNGILCQLPLPKHIDEEMIIERISPDKDVDGFSKTNVGKLWLGKYDLAPCTPMGVIELLEYYNIDISGKNCVIVGRSNIVGKPMAALLLERNGSVTICHSKTKELADVTSKADILVSAIGKAGFISGDMVKQDAVVIDVGINRNSDGKLCGDVDFESVKQKASYITPVPGGCGPMTIAILMKNTLIAAEKQRKIKENQ